MPIKGIADFFFVNAVNLYSGHHAAAGTKDHNQTYEQSDPHGENAELKASDKSARSVSP